MSRCDDCGVPLDRHGEDCGYYHDEPYGNPEWGRPLGWADMHGRMVDPFTLARRNPCGACGSPNPLSLTAAYDLTADRGGGRCWLYECGNCTTEYVYTRHNGLQRLAPADQDDTAIPGRQVEPLSAAGDPLHDWG